MDRVYVMQLVRAFQVGQISRRDFLRRAGVALGSVASAQLLLAACGSAPTAAPPVVDESPEEEPAGAVSTPSTGLITEDITYPDGEGGELMGYLARPEAASGPAVVVVQEWWGLNEHIRDVTRRFAQQGYVALAPDLYDGVVTTEPDEARKLVMELDMVEATREIGQAVAFLLDQEYVASDTAGIVGFCMGGGLVLQTARIFETVGATVAFYGSPLEPEQAANVQTPVLGLYGEADQGIPVEEVRAMEAAFAAADITHTIEIYEGAGHAFFNDTRDSYAPEAADDAWNRTLAWFEAHL